MNAKHSLVKLYAKFDVTTFKVIVKNNWLTVIPHMMYM